MVTVITDICLFVNALMIFLVDYYVQFLREAKVAVFATRFINVTLFYYSPDYVRLDKLTIVI